MKNRVAERRSGTNTASPSNSEGLEVPEEGKIEKLLASGGKSGERSPRTF